MIKPTQDENGWWFIGHTVLLAGDRVFGWQPRLGDAGLWVSGVIEWRHGRHVVAWDDGPLAGTVVGLGGLDGVQMLTPAKLAESPVDGPDDPVLL